ncbi:hypothetical protein B0I35DRAFT_470483 [Stachybotrys elegans]|uniref:SMP-30/Gluconolactonase/LRE-like region domain-containing protein n=1 Tax=Stachybotrys elegans TaxID=80388 RepID=A0A8K0SHY5_9HYPO|nr:hypothetical protein B0I35DRAFT_470483 [Stachybotrys elegans]
MTMSSGRALSIRALLSTFVVVLVAVLYRLNFHSTVIVLLGLGRVIEPIESFPYDCQRVAHPLLEACEDLWLDEKGRKLYAACASIPSRLEWFPASLKFNASARQRTDHIAVMDIDEPGADGLYGLRALDVEDEFQGNLDLLGFDARYVDGNLRFWIINHRPPTDAATGDLLDAWKHGANSTIEIFDLKQGSNKLQHIKTIHSDALVTPNDVAVDKDGNGFIVTNDHAAKMGLWYGLGVAFGGTSLTYCRSDTGKCHFVAEKSFNIADGVALGHNGLFYVGDMGLGLIKVYRLVEQQLVYVDTIHLQVPIDNLAVDSQGSIIAATMPDTLQTLGVIANPYDGLTAPFAAWKLEPEEGNTYKVTKMIEDRDGKVLPSASVAIHDAQTQRLFLSGVVSQFIAVCQKRT